MTKIEIVQSFVHGGHHFTAGEVRMVSAADAAYFCGVGWARGENLEVGSAPSDVTLQIHNGKHVASDNLSGVKSHG